MRVKITKKATVKPGRSIGPNSDQFPYYYPTGEWTIPQTEVRNTLTSVPEEEASLNAEGGETAYVPDMNNMPAHFKISGPRHSGGGVNLSLPPDSFIFSDTRDMKLGGSLLKFFGKSEDTKKKYTPADLAKQYDINKFRKQLQDPSSDDLQRDTAMKMIDNYQKKLGMLGLAQEAKKGFPTGIPQVAMPFLESAQVDPSHVLPLTSQPDESEQSGDMDNEQGEMKYGGNYSWANSPTGGGFWQDGGEPIFQRGGSGPLKERLQAIRQANAKAEAENQKKLKALKDKQLRDFVTKDSTWRSNQINSSVQTVENILDRASGMPDDIIQNRLLHQAEVITDQIEKAQTDLPLYSNPENYSPSIGSKQGSPYKFNPVNAKPLPPPPPQPKPVWSQNSDKSWTQAALPALPSTNPATIPQDNIDPYQAAQQAMYDYTGITPMDTTSIPTTSINLNPEQSDTTGLGVFKSKFNLKKYGGDMRDGGGGVKSKDTTFTAYNDGSIKNNKTGKFVQAATPGWKPKAAAKPPVGNIPTIAPYGDLDAAMVQTGNYRDPNQVAYDEQVAKKQHRNPKGGYGKQNASFTSNWADVLNEFEKQFGHKYVKKSSPNSEATWIQSAMRDAVIQDAKKVGYPDDLAVNMANELTFNGDVDGTIRSLDGKHGDYTDSRIRYKFKPYQAAAASVKQAGDIIPGPYKPVSPDGNAPWWAQDVVDTLGNAYDYLNLKKYLPWAPKVAPVIPDPTFFDPTRVLANNTEQMNIGVQGANAYGNPQAYGSNFSSMQGKGATAAANIMADYDNRNVQVSNQFAGMKADSLNKANEYNANTSKDLYDKTTVANQQFDNAKRESLGKLRDSYINAITNRADAQRFNARSPYYHVDPEFGGTESGLYAHMNGWGSASKEPTLDDFLSKYGPQMGVKEAGSLYADMYGPHADLYSQQASNEEQQSIRNPGGYIDPSGGYRRRR